MTHVVKEREKVKKEEVVVDTNLRDKLWLNGKTLSHPHASVELVDDGDVATSDNETASYVENLAEDIVELIEEINNRMYDGTADLMNNLTEGIDDKLSQLPEQSANELSTYLGDLANDIQRAQRNELERQVAEIEKRLIQPLEDLAFSDAPLFETQKGSAKKKKKKIILKSDTSTPKSKELILMGENSTLAETKSMRTREILKNFNVAPFYYSISLLSRWFKKASEPSVYLLSVYKNLASIIKSNTKPRRSDRSMGGENMQAGWKRTGEIAAKGPLARKWAVLRRSAEIWAYFSSFYLKDRRITAKYNSGRWSEERMSEERSKLGAEITQNLLKLGPVSISSLSWYSRQAVNSPSNSFFYTPPPL